jgi:hypothetical protein
LAQVPTSTAAGGNKRGTHATDWQKSRTSATQVASGNYSGILSGQNNTASNTGAAVVGGNSNTASSVRAAILGGDSNTANNSNAAVVGGAINTASGQNSVVIGGTTSTANTSNSAVLGGYGGSVRSVIGYTVFPASNAPINFSAGTSQTALLVLGKQTTDATATTITSNSSVGATNNQVILPNNSAYTFQGTCVANVTGGGDSSGWKFEGVIKRGANAASTALVAAVTPLVIAQDVGAATWVLAITADTTNGGIAVTVTGAAATTIRWVVKIETTEVTF